MSRVRSLRSVEKGNVARRYLDYVDIKRFYSNAQPLGELNLMARSANASVPVQVSSLNALSSQGGHSAQVKMRLLVNGCSISVAQMGPDFLLVDARVNHPPGTATLVLQVDQNERRWIVHLPEGISAASRRVAIAVNV